MPPFLLNFIFGLVLRYVAWLLTPPPEPPTPGTWDDVGFRKTADGSDAGVIFGTVWRDSSSMFQHWGGDFRKRPIKSKQGKKG